MNSERNPAHAVKSNFFRRLFFCVMTLPPERAFARPSAYGLTTVAGDALIGLRGGAPSITILSSSNPKQSAVFRVFQISRAPRSMVICDNLRICFSSIDSDLIPLRAQGRRFDQVEKHEGFSSDGRPRRL